MTERTPTGKAEALVLELRRRGVDATDLRHCVHEASHALDARMKEPWSNEAVSRAMRRIGPGRAAASELLARVVEQIVCKRLGVMTKPLAHWIGTSVMEAAKFGDPFLGYNEALEAAQAYMDAPRALHRAEEILALAGPKRVRRKKGATSCNA